MTTESASTFGRLKALKLQLEDPGRNSKPFHFQTTYELFVSFVSHCFIFLCLIFTSHRGN